MNTREFIRQVPILAWLIMFSILCAGIFGNLLGSLTTEISADLTLTPKHIGWLVFWGNVGSAIGAFLGGDLVHRVSARHLLMTYLLGLLVAIGIMVASTGFAMLISGFILYEVMVIAMATLGHTLIGKMQLVSSIRARVLALLDVGWSIGASIAPIWVIVLLRAYPNWRVPYAVFTVLVLVLLFAYSRAQIRQAIAQLSLISPAQDTSHETSHDSATPSAPAQHAHTYLQLMFAPWAIWAWIAAILIGYVEWGHSFWFVNYAHSGREIALDQARVGLVGFTLGMVLVRSWQAFIHSELTIEQRLIRLSLVGCVAFVLIAFFPNSATLPYMFVTNFFAGVGIGVVFPILLNHLIDFAPHDTAKFSALLMFCIIIGAQSAGLVVGYVSELLGVSIGYMTIAFAMIGFYISIMQLFRIHKKMHHAPN